MGPDVTKTELVSPVEVTVNGASVNEVVPRVPVASPENVKVIGLPSARSPAGVSIHHGRFRAAKIR